MKIIVSRQELQAAALFVSNDESRFILNGVCIEAKPNKAPVIVATDGRRMVAIESKAEQAEEFHVEHSLLLRTDFLKVIVAFSKARGAKLFPWIALDNNPGSKRLEVSIVGVAAGCWVDQGALIEGEFPNWRKSVPAKSARREPVNEVGLNAEMIGDFAKAAKFMEASSPTVQMHMAGKEGAVEVKLAGLPEVYGLIMSSKLDEVEYQPEFLEIFKACPPKTEEEESPDEDADEQNEKEAA